MRAPLPHPPRRRCRAGRPRSILGGSKTSLAQSGLRGRGRGAKSSSRPLGGHHERIASRTLQTEAHPLSGGRAGAGGAAWRRLRRAPVSGGVGSLRRRPARTDGRLARRGWEEAAPTVAADRAARGHRPDRSRQAVRSGRSRRPCPASESRDSAGLGRGACCRCAPRPGGGRVVSDAGRAGVGRHLERRREGGPRRAAWR